MNGIHRNIKKYRDLKELTQQEMADKLYISLKAYQNFENGITKLDLERLQEVAKILEVSVDDLINSEDGVYISEIKNNDVGLITERLQSIIFVQKQKRSYTKE